MSDHTTSYLRRISPGHSSLRSLVNVLGSDQWSEDVVPTVAFNLRQVRKGNVTMKVWDVAVSSQLTTLPSSSCVGPTEVPGDVGQVLSRGRCDSVSSIALKLADSADEQICR